MCGIIGYTGSEDVREVLLDVQSTIRAKLNKTLKIGRAHV